MHPTGREASTPVDPLGRSIGPEHLACAQWRRERARRALGDKETNVMTRQRSRFPHRLRAGWAVLAVLALVAGACGDDDDDTAVGDTAAGSTETDTGSTGDDAAAFCQARIDLERAFGSVVRLSSMASCRVRVNCRAPSSAGAACSAISVNIRKWCGLK